MIGLKILLFVLISQPISAQTGEDQQITVNADSLYQVFSNYEKCKVTVRGLKLDTTDLRLMIRDMTKVVNNQEQVINNYKAYIIPKYKQLDENHTIELKRIRRKNKWRIVKYSAVFLGGGIILGSTLK